MVLEAMYRGLELRRAVFALVTADHAAVRGRLGLGDDATRFVESFVIPLSARAGPIPAALTGRKDLFLPDGSRFGGEFGRPAGTAGFGLLPVVVEGVTVGCFFLEPRESGPRLSGKVLGLLSRLRDLAAEAIVLTRSSELAAE
jgi:hypothetical protein